MDEAGSQPLISTHRAKIISNGNETPVLVITIDEKAHEEDVRNITVHLNKDGNYRDIKAHSRGKPVIMINSDSRRIGLLVGKQVIKGCYALWPVLCPREWVLSRSNSR